MSAHRHSKECKEIFAMLSEYLDMELPANACDEIEAHLKDCPPCIEFVESLQKTIEMCHQYSHDSGPSQLSDTSRAALEEAYRKMLAARTAEG